MYMQFLIRAVLVATKLNPVVVHCHDIQALPVGVAMKVLKPSIKLVYDTHELWVGKVQDKGFILRRAVQLIEWLGVRQSEKVITVSEGIAQFLADKNGCNKPLVLRNIFEISSVESSIQDYPSIRQRLGLDPDLPIILYQGGIKTGRGLTCLVKSMKYLRSTAILVLLGQGPQRLELNKVVHSVELDEKVIFLDPIPSEQLASFSASATLGVIPTRSVHLSYYYSLPNKLFEYIHAGLPIIASDLPEVRHIVDQYKIGELFNQDDPHDLARAIDSVLFNPSYYDELKRNVAKACMELCWQIESNKLLDLYGELSVE